MSKKITFKTAREIQSISKKLDQWVEGGASDNPQPYSDKKISPQITTQKEEIYRFTIVIPRYLHKRIKKTCAVEGITMSEKLTQIFEENFPES